MRITGVTVKRDNTTTKRVFKAVVRMESDELLYVGEASSEDPKVAVCTAISEVLRGIKQQLIDGLTVSETVEVTCR